MGFLERLVLPILISTFKIDRGGVSMQPLRHNGEVLHGAPDHFEPNLHRMFGERFHHGAQAVIIQPGSVNAQQPVDALALRPGA